MCSASCQSRLPLFDYYNNIERRLTSWKLSPNNLLYRLQLLCAENVMLTVDWGAESFITLDVIRLYQHSPGFIRFASFPSCSSVSVCVTVSRHGSNINTTSVQVPRKRRKYCFFPTATQSDLYYYQREFL
jgi:hypothetical protein